MSTNNVIRRRKRRRSRGFPAWAGFFLIVAVAAFGPYYAYKLLQKINTRAVFNPSGVEYSSPELQAQIAQYERKIYPYSIIQGGVRSREELSAHIRSDYVVAKHYSGFNVSQARIITAPVPRYMHVSYRIGDTVYWTAKKILIPLGEALITDGIIEARTRCGNMLSDTEMTPLSGEEPDVEFFDIPQTAGLDSTELEPFIEPGLTPLSQFPEEELPDTIIPLTGPPPPTLAWVPPYPIGPGYLPPTPIPPNGGRPPNPPWPPNPPRPPNPPPDPPDLPDPPDPPPDTPDPPDPPDPPPPGPPWPPTPPPLSEVPEPGTMVMVFTGLAAIVTAVGIRRRKK